jgi:hypothetical protein
VLHLPLQAGQPRPEVLQLALQHINLRIPPPQLLRQLLLVGRRRGLLLLLLLRRMLLRRMLLLWLLLLLLDMSLRLTLLCWVLHRPVATRLHALVGPARRAQQVQPNCW